MLVMYGFCFAQIINICYIRPYADGRSKNYQEICNEVFIILISYTMICFTDAVESIDAQSAIGHVAYTLVFLHLLMNLSLIIFQNGRHIFKRIKARIVISEQQKTQKRIKQTPPPA